LGVERADGTVDLSSTRGKRWKASYFDQILSLSKGGRILNVCTVVRHNRPSTWASLTVCMPLSMIGPSQLACKDARTYRERKLPELASCSHPVPCTNASRARSSPAASSVRNASKWSGNAGLFSVRLPLLVKRGRTCRHVHRLAPQGEACRVDATSEHKFTSFMRALFT
jgi:hypothetical protein